MYRLIFSLGVMVLLLLGCSSEDHHANSSLFSELPHRPASVAGLNNKTVWPGAKPDGSVQLPNQWSLHPIGRQIELADFPVNVAVHPDGRFAAVLHSGYSQHQIFIVDLVEGQVCSRFKINEGFYGLAFSKDGKTLVCSGAGDELLHVFSFRHGKLDGHDRVRLREPKKRGVPAGLALNAAATQAYVANVWGDAVSRVTLRGSPGSKDILLSTNLDLGTQAPIRPSSDPDTAAAQKRAEAALRKCCARDVSLCLRFG